MLEFTHWKLTVLLRGRIIPLFRSWACSLRSGPAGLMVLLTSGLLCSVFPLLGFWISFCLWHPLLNLQEKTKSSLCISRPCSNSPTISNYLLFPISFLLTSDFNTISNLNIIDLLCCLIILCSLILPPQINMNYLRTDLIQQRYNYTLCISVCNFIL